MSGNEGKQCCHKLWCGMFVFDFVVCVFCLFVCFEYGTPLHLWCQLVAQCNWLKKCAYLQKINASFIN